MNKTLGPRHFWGLLLAAMLLLGGVFTRFGVSFWDFGKFLLGLTVVVYFPGSALCGLARLKVSRTESVHLAAVIGMAASTAVYKLARLLHAPVLFLLWLSLAAAYFLYRMIKHPPRKQSFSFRISPAGIVFVLLALLVLGVLSVDNYRNGIEQEDGSLVVNMHYYDGYVRNAVVRELSHTLPPQMPFAAGFPLSYHYGMDLFIVIFYEYFDLGVFDLLHRFTLTFFCILFLSSVFLLTRKVSGSSSTALIASFLALFSSGGFAYVASYLMGINQWGNLFYSFYFFHFLGINSLLPGAVILLTGFFCIAFYLESRSVAWMWFTILLFVLSFEFKIFFLGPLLGALFLGSMLGSMFQKDHSLWKVFLGTGLLAVPLLIFSYVSNLNGPRFTFNFQFVDWIRFSLHDLRLIALQRAWGDLIHRGVWQLRSFLAVPAVLLLFFVGSFGMSALALPRMIRELFSVRRKTLLRVFLILFFLGCVLFYFGVNVRLDGRDRNVTNIYVYLMGLIILNLLWAETLMNFVKSKKAAWKFVLLILALLLAIPNSARFLWIKSRTPQPRRYSPALMDTVDWIRDHTDAEGVFIHPLEMDHLCFLMDRRVVLDVSAHSFLTWHLTASQINERTKDINRFFAGPLLNADVLDTYRVDYVLGSTGTSLGEGKVPDEISLYFPLKTRQVRKVKKSHVLIREFANEMYYVYRIRSLPEAERGVFLVEEEGGKLTFRRFQPLK